MKVLAKSEITPLRYLLLRYCWDFFVEKRKCSKDFFCLFVEKKFRRENVGCNMYETGTLNSNLRVSTSTAAGADF